MEWDVYQEVIESPEDEYRTNVPALFADPEVFDTFVNDLATQLDPETFEHVAGIDALGFIPGTALARRFGVGLITIRKDGKLPIRDRHREADTLVDYTGMEKTLELDRRQIPRDEPILLVDDWMETASQVGTAIDLIERAGGTVGGIALLAAETNETTRRLDETYGVSTVNPFPE